MKTPRIAIHHFPDQFSERWIAWFEERGIPWQPVDCYHTDIIARLRDSDGLMWHWSNLDPATAFFARQLTFSLERIGKEVFPDSRSCWHFDDKVGQKYLLEAVGAPLVPSRVFYSPAAARDWLRGARFPLVFKLRGGSSSRNVRLVPDRKTALALVRQAFGRGFRPFDPWQDLKDRIHRYRDGTHHLTGVLKGIGRLVIPTDFVRLQGVERGYIYFQDFIPGNTMDTRVVVIGPRAFAIRRLCRTNDFRASGSGAFLYDRAGIDERCVRIALELSRRLDVQCLAYDFVFDGGRPLLVEISYGFNMPVYDPCPGYWDEAMVWHEGPFNPQAFMAEDFLARILARRSGPGSGHGHPLVLQRN